MRVKAVDPQLGSPWLKPLFPVETPMRSAEGLSVAPLWMTLRSMAAFGLVQLPRVANQQWAQLSPWPRTWPPRYLRLMMPHLPE